MKNIVNKRIDVLTNNFAKSYDDLVEKNISKAGYDKTLIGFVSEKIERDDGSYRWRIQTDGTAYDIAPEMCNITEVGQRVRLYIPNHSFKDKYAEVIENTSDDIPIEIKKVSDNKVIIKHKDRIVTWTADGSGNTRYNLKCSIEWI